MLCNLARSVMQGTNGNMDLYFAYSWILQDVSDQQSSSYWSSILKTSLIAYQSWQHYLEHFIQKTQKLSCSPILISMTENT